jgi:hypothetical protein
MKDYSYLKILAWRFIRTALATSLVVCIALRPDFSNIKEISIGFIAGFIVALAKALRDYLSKGDDSALIDKFPL